MKKHLKFIPILLAPFAFANCGPTTETHNVRIIESRKATPKPPSDDPREFRPVKAW